MDEDVIRAMLKWPNVPALYGWVRLDRRGNWYIQGERVTRAALVAFIGRNYDKDERGRWFFQNGPQRCYVELDYTPWVLQAQPEGGLRTHTGLPVERPYQAFLDEQGSLLIYFERGLGLLAETDLDWGMSRLQGSQGPLDESRLASAIETLMAGEPADLVLCVGGLRLPVQFMPSDQAPSRFGYDPKPAAGEEKQ
ncbi:MAG: DUF2946 family protein [Xanthomonadaceae bacterium]|nr:DUF2946 family protein [Xanthomonadaceae bacterium]